MTAAFRSDSGPVEKSSVEGPAAGAPPGVGVPVPPATSTSTTPWMSEASDIPARVSAARLGRWEWDDTHHEERGRDGGGKASVDELSAGDKTKTCKKNCARGLKTAWRTGNRTGQCVQKTCTKAQLNGGRSREPETKHRHTQRELEAQHTVAYAPVGKPYCLVADGQDDRANNGRAR